MKKTNSVTPPTFNLQCTYFIAITTYVLTSFPYFGVKLSCVCLMIAYRKKLPKVTQR